VPAILGAIEMGSLSWRTANGQKRPVCLQKNLSPVPESAQLSGRRVFLPAQPIQTGCVPTSRSSSFIRRGW